MAKIQTKNTPLAAERTDKWGRARLEDSHQHSQGTDRHTTRSTCSPHHCSTHPHCYR